MLDRIAVEAEGLEADRRRLRVTPDVERAEIREHLAARYAFTAAKAPAEILEDVCQMLRCWTVQVTHPRYFGLFNPAVRPITVAADALVALFNPQLAAWSHAPAANEIERHVLRFFAEQIGSDGDTVTAHFTSGGQEANFTAVVAALDNACPAVARHGLRALEAQPVLYMSELGHQSVHKAAQCIGLGVDAVRLVPCDAALRMDVSALARQITNDRRAGLLPFLVVGTAGTTSAGTVDPIEPIADLCSSENLWLHLDAAWAGSVLLSERHRDILRGIERVSSVTWDAHKWLAVPIGAGMFFSRRPLGQMFDIPQVYVPPAAPGVADAYTSTFQWSRRFIGLKVLMSLAELGVNGYRELIDHQMTMGQELRDRLIGRGWTILNETPLPVVCFSHPALRGQRDAVRSLVQAVSTRGLVWVSNIALPDREHAVRACITSYLTEPGDLGVLVDELERALPQAASVIE